MEDKIYNVLEKYGIDEPKASAITEDLLVLCGVVKSLPSKNALTVKAWVEAKEHKLNNEKVDLKAYAFGFVDGGEWVKSEAK